MRSSSGAHYIALDHVRALAAFMVFAWHFTHAKDGYPIPFEYVPAFFPAAVLDEGHTGVALFLTLSGYLFAKLLDGRSIVFRWFLWNRFLRLFPLLAFVFLIVGIFRVATGETTVAGFAWTLAKGLVLPTLPNGGWSITVEFHFYLLLPLFLRMAARSKWLPLSIVAAAVALRLALHHAMGEVQSLAYWTIVGRVDQFTLGMLAFHFRAHLAHRHILALAVIAAFLAFYWWFDHGGGYFLRPSYPSPSLLWTVFPTIEGAAYATAIAWYDNSFVHRTTGISGFVGRIGEYSYSIYLLHFFFVFPAAWLVHERIMDISNFYLACLWAAFFFVLMVIPGYFSFRYIESPFLRRRRRYLVGSAA
jgi:peptidoglycan/LPS O-acetylase OafA/YrhL